MAGRRKPVAKKTPRKTPRKTPFRKAKEALLRKSAAIRRNRLRKQQRNEERIRKSRIPYGLRSLGTVSDSGSYHRAPRAARAPRAQSRPRRYAQPTPKPRSMRSRVRPLMAQPSACPHQQHQARHCHGSCCCCCCNHNDFDFRHHPRKRAAPPPEHMPCLRDTSEMGNAVPLNTRKKVNTDAPPPAKRSKAQARTTKKNVPKRKNVVNATGSPKPAQTTTTTATTTATTPAPIPIAAAVSTTGAQPPDKPPQVTAPVVLMTYSLLSEDDDDGDMPAQPQPLVQTSQAVAANTSVMAIRQSQNSAPVVEDSIICDRCVLGGSTAASHRFNGSNCRSQVSLERQVSRYGSMLAGNGDENASIASDGSGLRSGFSSPASNSFEHFFDDLSNSPTTDAPTIAASAPQNEELTANTAEILGDMTRSATETSIPLPRFDDDDDDNNEAYTGPPAKRYYF